eukprot:SAG22_NODE_401_length_11080_cov_18.258082_3_plen_168_part_00
MAVRAPPGPWGDTKKLLKAMSNFPTSAFDAGDGTTTVAAAIPTLSVMMQDADALSLDVSAVHTLKVWRDSLGVEGEGEDADERRASEVAKSSSVCAGLAKWVLAFYRCAAKAAELRVSGELELSTAAGTIAVRMAGPENGPLALLLHGTHGEKYEWQYLWPVLHKYG